MLGEAIDITGPGRSKDLTVLQFNDATAAIMHLPGIFHFKM